MRCKEAGKPKEVLSMALETLPKELEWGQVLVSMRYAPINPADLYSVWTGGMYGNEAVTPPFTAGHDGVGVVQKVWHNILHLLYPLSCNLSSRDQISIVILKHVCFD